nr:glycosyltransferase family 4 protein [uncultured Bacteroides sp.]
MEKKLFVTARWNRSDIRKTWSGSGYALWQGLSKNFRVEKIALVNTWWYRCLQLARRVGMRFLSKPLEDIQTNILRKQIQQYKNIPVFMITGVFEVENPSYLYMDNIWEVAHLLTSSEAQNKHYFNHFFSYSSQEISFQITRQYNVFSKSKAIFLMGHWLADYMKDIYPEFKDKIYAVGGGCNAYSFNSDEIRRGNKILFVGKAFLRKGGDIVVEAFRLLRANYKKDAELIIVGPKTLPDKYRGEGIIFKGCLSFEEVGRLMKMCDVFCMPSRFEAYGLVFVEALLNGLPCIGRNAFEMPYFIEPGITGELIDEDDPEVLARKIVDVMANDEMKHAVAERRNEYESYYNWDRVCADITRIIKEKENER